MITLANFLKAIAQNAARVKEYHQPGDGSNGQCDCIGLIIGAVRLAGGKWNGLHGSNYAARSEIEALGPAKFFKGEIVFKARKEGDAYYKLPDRYKQGKNRFNGDLLDYYHVGVVTNDSPLEITHCTDPGPIVVDKKKGKWAYGGRLKGIDYGATIAPEEEKEAGQMTAIVTAENGTTVKMRQKPNKASNIYWDIPVGAEVEMLETGDTWNKIKYNGKTGYMMSDYLKPCDNGAPDEPVIETVIAPKEELLNAYNILEAAMRNIFVPKGDVQKAYDILGNILGLRG